MLILLYGTSVVLLKAGAEILAVAVAGGLGPLVAFHIGIPELVAGFLLTYRNQIVVLIYTVLVLVESR